MILIDPPTWPAYGRLWSHLISDTSYAELREFAAAVGLPERLYDGDHYDVPQERYQTAVDAGAQEVAGRDLIRRLLGSGLRRHQRDR
ncbi:DUF4031 domain-containing protein [Dermatophilaceae bacterium Sec6.4]